MNKPKKVKKYVKLNKYQKALIYIADMLERQDHYQFLVRAHILDILGLEDANKVNKK